MRTRIAVIAGLFGASLASAVTLRPSMIVHGVIRDAYGLRLSPNSAMVSAFFGTNEVARTPIRIHPAGANYRFEINVVDPLTARASDVVPGTNVAIRVRMGAASQPAIGTSTFVARGDGSSVNINLILGVDSDNDGLPDDWEWMAIANSGGAVSRLNQVGPGRDLDGDGMSDDQEFFNGSFPFLPGDELRLGALTGTADGRLRFSFTSVPGASYAVESTSSLGPPDWRVTPVSVTEGGPLSMSRFGGDGQLVTVYFAPGGPTHFYRLRSR